MAEKLFSMKILTVFFIKFVCVLGNCNNAPASSIPPAKYPCPRRDENISDTYFKTTIKDPYQWMEDPDNQETMKFVEAEIAITKPYLEQCPFRSELESRYKELYGFPKYSCPTPAGNKFYSFQNTGLQNQDVLYVQNCLNDEPKVFFDPNTLSTDDSITLDGTSFSYDGSIMAYSLGSSTSSDVKTVQFKHVQQGDIYKEKLNNVQFSCLTWTHDNKGIFYGGYFNQKVKTNGSGNNANESDKNYKLYYHLVGTDQSCDVLVAEFPDHPEYLIGATVSDDGKYVIVDVTAGTQNNLVYIADLAAMNFQIKGKLQLISLVTKMDANYGYLTNNDNIFIFQTNKNADKYKLIAIDITKPNPESWTDFVPQTEDILEWSTTAYQKYIIICYTHNVHSVLQLHDIKTGNFIKKFNLEIGAVDSFSGDMQHKDIFFSFTSFLTPGIIYHCDLSKPPFELELYREIKMKNFEPANFMTEQVFYTSKDGTKIPMFIVHKKDLQKNGNNPAYITTYGEFGVSTLPYFSVRRILFLCNFDGLHAIPGIRGGGEFGEEWHRAGQLANKQKSFDDFQAGAEYLITQKYTTNKLLVVSGGLLAGACLNQRPDLFGAVIAERGVMDMLRYDNFTIGHAWVTEYGSSSVENEFNYLVKYSPLHNINISKAPQQYPATLLETSDHDDRVPALHSLKFIATLQWQAKSNPNQSNPLIIRIDRSTGVGSSQPLDKMIAEVVDELSFIAMNLGIKFHS